MHAEFRIDDSVVMVGDAGGQWPAIPTFLHVYVDDVDQTYRRALDCRRRVGAGAAAETRRPGQARRRAGPGRQHVVDLHADGTVRRTRRRWIAGPDACDRFSACATSHRCPVARFWRSPVRCRWPRAPRLPPSKIPVGLELYSVRDFLAKDLTGTVRAVAKLGYEVVEFYSPYLQWTPQVAVGRAEAARRARRQVPVDAQRQHACSPPRDCRRRSTSIRPSAARPSSWPAPGRPRRSTTGRR